MLGCGIAKDENADCHSGPAPESRHKRLDTGSRSPLVNTLRNQFFEPSKEVIDTILVGQTQVKDGFLAND
jgi:hypothetical protein